MDQHQKHFTDRDVRSRQRLFQKSSEVVRVFECHPYDHFQVEFRSLFAKKRFLGTKGRSLFAKKRFLGTQGNRDVNNIVNQSYNAVSQESLFGFFLSQGTKYQQQCYLRNNVQNNVQTRNNVQNNAQNNVQNRATVISPTTLALQ